MQMLSQNPNATDEDVDKVVAQYYSLPPADTAAAAAHEHALAGGKVRVQSAAVSVNSLQPSCSEPSILIAPGAPKP